MNSVHESGPNGDSEPIPSRKTRLKPSQVHEHQNWPNRAPKHAQARAGLVVSWPGLVVSWPRPPAVSQLQAVVSQRPARPCALCHARLCAMCRARHAPGPSAVTQCPRPYRGRVPRAQLFLYDGLAFRPCRDTKSSSYPLIAVIQCSVLQYTGPYC